MWGKKRSSPGNSGEGGGTGDCGETGEALHSGYEHFRKLIENALDLVSVLGADGTIIYMSPSVQSLLGYEAAEMSGENIFSYTHPEDIGRARSALSSAAGRPGVTQYFEIRVRHRDGSWRLHEASSYNLLHDPAVGGLVVSSRDITDRKRADEVLRESEERYRVTFESTGTAMGLIEPDGTISITNSEFEKLVGYSREEVEGRSKYWEFVHADDLRAVKSLAGRMARGELPMPFRYECRLRHREGETQHVLVSVNSLPGINRSVVSIIDITGRKRAEEVLRESEESYRATFETTGTAMFLVDENAMLSGANREMEKVFGYSRDEVVGRMEYMRLIVPEDVDKVKRMSLRMLKGEIEGPIQYEIRARHKSGRPIDALISVNTLPGAGKSVVSLIDISVQKAYERQLEENAERLRDFLDVAAHELRHPATLLKGYAVTLGRRGGEISREDWFASLRGIEAGADRLIYVMEELLDASRLQRGKFAVNKECIPLDRVAVRAAEEMRMRGTGRDIRLDLQENLGVACIDLEKTMRLFIILLDNAVKYSPPESLVELKGEVKDGEIVFAVLDRGTGIRLEDREMIFDRFYQVGGAKHHSGPGLGLGLYISRRIVEAHGGRIWYEPRAGGGSAFYFSLPPGDCGSEGQATKRIKIR